MTTINRTPFALSLATMLLLGACAPVTSYTDAEAPQEPDGRQLDDAPRFALRSGFGPALVGRSGATAPPSGQRLDRRHRPSDRRGRRNALPGPAADRRGFRRAGALRDRRQRLARSPIVPPNHAIVEVIADVSDLAALPQLEQAIAARFRECPKQQLRLRDRDQSRVDGGQPDRPGTRPGGRSLCRTTGGGGRATLPDRQGNAAAKRGRRHAFLRGR